MEEGRGGAWEEGDERRIDEKEGEKGGWEQKEEIRRGWEEEEGGWGRGRAGQKEGGGVGWEKLGERREGVGSEEEDARGDNSMIKELKKGIKVLKEEKEKLMEIIQEDLDEKIRKTKEVEELVKEEK